MALMKVSYSVFVMVDMVDEAGNKPLGLRICKV